MNEEYEKCDRCGKLLYGVRLDIDTDADEVYLLCQECWKEITEKVGTKFGGDEEW